jgi:hypothetical protein
MDDIGNRLGLDHTQLAYPLAPYAVRFLSYSVCVIPAAIEHVIHGLQVLLPEKLILAALDLIDREQGIYTISPP